jgi:hypothetical protein
VRQVEGHEVCLLLDASDHRQSFPEVRLCLARRMGQRDEISWPPIFDERT